MGMECHRRPNHNYNPKKEFSVCTTFDRGRCGPCRQDARFVDPLMDVGTPREIHLAFISLIKLFKSIDMEQKSLTWAPQPQGLPQGLLASDVQQVPLIFLMLLRFQ